MKSLPFLVIGAVMITAALIASGLQSNLGEIAGEIRRFSVSLAGIIGTVMMTVGFALDKSS